MWDTQVSFLVFIWDCELLTNLLIEQIDCQCLLCSRHWGSRHWGTRVDKTGKVLTFVVLTLYCWQRDDKLAKVHTVSSENHLCERIGEWSRVRVIRDMVLASKGWLSWGEEEETSCVTTLGREQQTEKDRHPKVSRGGNCWKMRWEI